MQYTWALIADTCVAHQLSWYGFIGRILGKALYDGILVDVSFAGFFRKLSDVVFPSICELIVIVAKWLGRQSYLDDLNSLDSELYKGLTSKSPKENLRTEPITDHV